MAKGRPEQEKNRAGQEYPAQMPRRVVELPKAPPFSEVLEEMDGDYRAARVEYMNRYGVDPTSPVQTVR